MKKIPASVLLINYNKEKCVSRCLNYLTKQDFKEFEVIFSDDKSDDNSILIAKKYKKKLDLKIIENQKKGRDKHGSYNQIKSILRAFKESSGEIIFLLDSDDFFHKKKVSTIVDFFNNNKEKKIIFDLPFIYYNQNNIKKFNIKKRIFKKNIWPHFPPQSCISMRRDFFQEIFFKISFHKFHNIWFDFRVAFYSYFISKNFEIYNKRLTYYFVDPKGVSSEFKYLTFNWWQRRLEAFYYSNYFLKKHSLKFPLTIDYILTKLIFRLLVFLKKIKKFVNYRNK
jgi:glycosyltransferase involved in cell wall biosynthesis